MIKELTIKKAVLKELIKKIKERYFDSYYLDRWGRQEIADLKSETIDFLECRLIELETDKEF